MCNNSSWLVRSLTPYQHLHSQKFKHIYNWDGITDEWLDKDRQTDRWSKPCTPQELSDWAIKWSQKRNLATVKMCLVIMWSELTNQHVECRDKVAGSGINTVKPVLVAPFTKRFPTSSYYIHVQWVVLLYNLVILIIHIYISQAILLKLTLILLASYNIAFINWPHIYRAPAFNGHSSSVGFTRVWQYLYHEGSNIISVLNLDIFCRGDAEHIISALDPHKWLDGIGVWTCDYPDRVGVSRPRGPPRHQNGNVTSIQEPPVSCDTQASVYSVVYVINPRWIWRIWKSQVHHYSYL